MQNRVPNIRATRRDLRWAPRTSMKAALALTFDAYRGQLAEARELVS